MALKETGGGYSSPDLTLTFGPGVVRYLDPRSLAGENRDEILRDIELLGEPKLEFPSKDFSPYDLKAPDDRGGWRARLKFEEFPPLFDDRPVGDLLIDLGAIFDAYMQAPFPSEAYWAFHSYLEADRLLLAEFFDSWVREASGDFALAESYANSDDHVLLTIQHSGRGGHVFRKTPFFREVRRAIEQAAEQMDQEFRRRESEDEQQRMEEALRVSSFGVFTYLMEDSRNGLTKIGKSQNPGRRENTLQSEAPTVVLRFAIPTDDDMEALLHERFDEFRRRGEWFELTPDDIYQIVSSLLAEGDVSRAIVDPTWLGGIVLAAFSFRRKASISDSD